MNNWICLIYIFIASKHFLFTFPIHRSEKYAALETALLSTITSWTLPDWGIWHDEREYKWCNPDKRFIAISFIGISFIDISSICRYKVTKKPCIALLHLIRGLRGTGMWGLFTAKCTLWQCTKVYNDPNSSKPQKTIGKRSAPFTFHPLLSIAQD